LLARDAAEEALGCLSAECSDEDSFKPARLEWDEYTRVRNTVALGAWAGWCLLNRQDSEVTEKCVSTLSRFLQADRLVFWGESAFATVCAITWLFETHGKTEACEKLLLTWLMAVIHKQQPESEDPLADPFESPEAVLSRMVDLLQQNGNRRKTAVQSYCLLPLVLMFVRRRRRDLLAKVWKKLSQVSICVFEYDSPAGYLEWRCEKGVERSFIFRQPQSYGELCELASSPAVQKLPLVLRTDSKFRLMFFLAFPHRLAWSIVGSLDQSFHNGVDK